MKLTSKLPLPSPFKLTALASAASAMLFGAALMGVAPAASAADAALKSYDSTSKDYWKNPPPDWFLGDETEAQKGLAPPSGPATGMSAQEIDAALKNVKLPPGFSISVYASDIPSARQMAWGDKGTLFVGSFGVGTVYAIVNEGGKKVVKTILTGMKMPTGIAFRDGSLYVADIDRIIKYDDAEAHLDKMPEGKVVYDDMPSYVAHGWKYLTFDKEGWLYVPFGPPCNECMAPSGTSQIRRINPKSGLSEVVALGVRNSVGGDIDPRSGQYWFTENARDWISDNLPSDKLNRIGKIGQHYGYPYCHQGDIPDPKLAMGHACSEFVPPVSKLGSHVAPLGMKFYTGGQFPTQYQNNIFIAEHGSWNRHQYQGGNITRVITDKDGQTVKTEVFASGWVKGERDYTGRPADVIVAADGSMLVADDWAGAVYQISYNK